MKQPNIVLIIADDLGHWTLVRNADAVTPHIDRGAEGCSCRSLLVAACRRRGPACNRADAARARRGGWLRLGNVTRAAHRRGIPARPHLTRIWPRRLCAA